ncbi:MAG: KUP/HAK/KT family potassium transporter [Bacteroidetes bacterium]|nr:KUP/HAK/KT family potassium transporter [Bacteroidota bacterium]
MHSNNHSSFHSKITWVGSLIATGIVFGDLGTSPLYTLNAVFHGKIITEAVALGSLSAIFWTLTLLTTIKYIILTLRADNKGEGGIFSLYSLIRKFFHKNLVIIAMIGGAFMIADGIITPPISVSSAVEGLRAVSPTLNTVPIVIIILILLFLLQQFGTDKIGKIFGPVMVVWFTFIGIVGLIAIGQNWTVFKAVNPYYAYNMLVNVPGGFWFLGGIFLCATGAEALYSDMGHVGRNNIRVSWMYIKVMLVLCYAGQTAWLLNHQGETIGQLSPFFHIIPDSIFWLAIGLATLATVIASQALITGVFTLINEAMQLNIWPKHRVQYPSILKGQLYIPTINWLLAASCIGMVLYFKESTKMEAAFGLSVNLTMLVSTCLLFFYLITKRVSLGIIALVTIPFLLIESSFLIANLQKIKEGGWVILVIGAALFLLMYIWHSGKKIKFAFTQFIKLESILPKLQQLSNDEAIDKYATNLVYLTSSPVQDKVEAQIIHSIFNNGIPKRADTYWVIHINILDEPFHQTYKAKTILKNDLYYIEINLGFKEEPRVGYYFKQIVNELIEAKEVIYTASHEKKYQENNTGDFKFIILESFLSYENNLPYWKNFILTTYYNLKKLNVKKSEAYEIDHNVIITEMYPLLISPFKQNILKKI